jgi:hypothetical protein
MYTPSGELAVSLVTIRWLQSEEKIGNKQTIRTEFNTEEFNLSKLSDLEVRKQYQMKIANRFAALENLNDSEDINLVWENRKVNTKTSYKSSLGLYELKHH